MEIPDELVSDRLEEAMKRIATKIHERATTDSMGHLYKQDQTKGLAPNMPLGAAFN